MQYGLYLSAAGVITSSYRQDVISNNMANSETVGFKRDLAMFQQRTTADQSDPLKAMFSSPMLDKIGGGTFLSPNYTDISQGTLESTNDPMDAGLNGDGFFVVQGSDGQQRLTRDGQFKTDTTGHLMLANAQSNPVLDVKGQPIRVDPTIPMAFDQSGRIIQNGAPIAQLNIVSVSDTTKLRKEGANLFADSDPGNQSQSSALVRGGFLERSNVDPSTELTSLMDAQRVLEANANMIHYQDQMLGDCVNTVGKIS